MSREAHVAFCEGLEVKLLGSTLQKRMEQDELLMIYMKALGMYTGYEQEEDTV